MNGSLCVALFAACDRFAASSALVGAGATLSYAEVGALAAALAARWRAQGVVANEPVHVAVSNQPLDLVAILAVWAAGAVAVPVHRTTPPAVAAQFQQRTGARWRVDLVDAAEPAAALVSTGVAPPPARALLDGAALVVFTSGSTGVPKGVVVSHDAFHGKIGAIDSLLHFGPADRTLLVLNITFSFGLWVSLLTLLRGGTLVMQSRFDPPGFLATLAEARITRVGMVPTMMRVLFSDPAQAPAIDALAQQGDLRQILIGGESLGVSLAAAIRARFRRTELVDIYGLTETATCDFFAFPADVARHPGCIGRPSPGVVHRIADPAGGEVVGGAVGELQIRSPWLMNGYLDEPALTAAARVDGWFRTGDLARQLDGGLVELMGRLKELISRGGNKVTPGEIEQALCAHPDVAAAMAVGVPDPVLGERIHALVVPRGEVRLDVAALQAHLAPRLERYKQPDTYHLAAALPLGRTGKADRGQFKAQLAAGEWASPAA